MFSNSRRLWLFVIALAVVAGILAPPVPAASPRLVVTVSEPFEVAGTVFEPGRLSVRTVRAFSPVADLSEIRVDGRSLGVVVARKDTRTAFATRDELIFERSETGRLTLSAVALKGEPVRKLYWIQAAGNPSTTEIATARSHSTWVASSD